MRPICVFLTASAFFTLAMIQPSHASENPIIQLLQGIWSMSESDADMQELDALYPITRYAGMGYNLLRGNPEGDFELGGKDPGIQNTRWIFNLTYSMGREGYYRGKTVAVPDQVNFHPTQTCTRQSLTRAYSGQTSYQKELERNINAGISGTGIHDQTSNSARLSLFFFFFFCRWLPEYCHIGILTQCRY